MSLRFVAAENFHDQFRQNQLVIELRADELKIRFETRFQTGNELFGLKTMRMLRGDAKSISVDRSILLTRQMFCRACRQTIERRDESVRHRRSRKSMSFHQIFGEK